LALIYRSRSRQVAAGGSLIAVAAISAVPSAFVVEARKAMNDL
jgi:hypothetical protein